MAYKINQIGFQALLSANQSNATGDGTTVNMVYDLVNYNYRGGYDHTTGIFTAQASGLYCFCGTICLLSLGAAHTQLLSQAPCSNGVTYNAYEVNPFVVADSGHNLIVQFTFHAYMQLSDTVNIQLTVSNGTKTVGLGGAGAFALNCFSGVLIA